MKMMALLLKLATTLPCRDSYELTYILRAGRRSPKLDDFADARQRDCRCAIYTPRSTLEKAAAAIIGLRALRHAISRSEG